RAVAAIRGSAACGAAHHRYRLFNPPRTSAHGEQVEIDYRLTSPIQLDVQLRVEGLTVLLGVNGAGKTSILRAIAGLIPADGTPYGGVPVQRRPIGYLPQHYALFPH